MKRDRGTALLVEMLRRLDEGGSWQLDVVEEVHLFGSYARGALEPHDHHRAEWKEHFHSTFGYGRDPNATLRMALRGHTRSLSIEFGRESHGDIPMTPLWRRGDPIEQAIDRVNAIVSDPVATRAPRDAMPEYLLPSGDKIPRYLRQELVTLVDGGAIDITAVALAAHVPAATWFNELIDDRWSPASPLRRTALAVLAHWEERGVDLAGVHLHGKDLDVDSLSTPYFAGFGLRYFRAMRRCFTEHDGEEWIEVVWPSLRGPVQALVVRQGPRFATFDWSVPNSSYFP